MRFEKPSPEELEKFITLLRGKSADEIICILGQPSLQTGAREYEMREKNGAFDEGVVKVIKVRRTLTFYNIGETIQRLEVEERVDGQRSLYWTGRAIPDEPAA